MRDLPLPPPELAGYVIGNVAVDDWMATYDEVGELVARRLVELIGDDWSWAGRRVLDFGCGSGRVLRHLAALAPDAELFGCDIDPACVEWGASHLCPPVEAITSCDEQPPLAYEDDSFDLVYATSVFSHLTSNWAKWLLELRRVLKPEGLLIASVVGEGASHAVTGEAYDDEHVGMNVHGYGRPWSAGGPMVVHSEWWLRAHWGRAMDVLAIAPSAMNGQDAVVLRHPGTPAPSADELRTPEPDEPRELSALAHHVDQLHREYAELNAAHDAYAAAYVKEQERVGQLEAELAAAREARRPPPAARLLARRHRTP